MFAMIPEDRAFILQIISIVVSAVLAYAMQRNSKKTQILANKTDTLTDKVDKNHEQTNSRMTDYLKAAEEKYLLIGEQAGRLKEREEESARQAALAAAATTAALLQIAQGTPQPEEPK